MSIEPCWDTDGYSGRLNTDSAGSRSGTGRRCLGGSPWLAVLVLGLESYCWTGERNWRGSHSLLARQPTRLVLNPTDGTGVTLDVVGSKRTTGDTVRLRRGREPFSDSVSAGVVVGRGGVAGGVAG